MAYKIVNFLNGKWISQLNSLNKKRSPMTKEEFVRFVSNKGYDFKTINIVYDALKNYLPQINSISLHPNDNVIEDYHIDAEDLSEMIIDQCLKKVGGKMPSDSDQKLFFEKHGDTPTVEKIIHFVDFFKA